MARLFLSYDTETTGLPLFKEPSEHPEQPHIVQLGARLIDIDTRLPVLTLDAIIKPNGWAIPDDVAAIHGINTERARASGIDEPVALAIFREMWNRAAFRLAYNEQFDARIIRIGLMRHFGTDVADLWKEGDAKCSARMATPIVNMPLTDKMMAAGRFTAKTPKLAEAYRHFFGEDFDDAHSALADVDASTAIYFKILDRQAGSAPAAALPGAPAPKASADAIRF